MSNSLDERTSLHNREGKRAKTSNNILLFLAHFYVSVYEGQKSYDSYRVKIKSIQNLKSVLIVFLIIVSSLEIFIIEQPVTITVLEILLNHRTGRDFCS